VRRQIRLIHWNKTEAEERAARIRAWKHKVDAEPLTPGGLRRLREHPPDAVVIDLSRLPSHGRDVGLGLRKYATTRRVPLVFVGGDADKLAGIKAHLPDAVCTTWGRLRAALTRAIANPPAAPVVPRSALAGYSGTPLPRKLGIRENSVVVLVNAPPGFRLSLGDLPSGAVVMDRWPSRFQLAVWFVRSLRDLESGIRSAAARLREGSLWIAWPKRSSSLGTDLTQQRVREAGLGAGLVDYKVCAIDATWSGLLFTRRKKVS
jgi:hypothetical protein